MKPLDLALLKRQQAIVVRWFCRGVFLLACLASFSLVCGAINGIR